MSNCNAGEMAMVVKQIGDCPQGCYMSTIVKVKTPLFTRRGLVWLVEDRARCVKSWSRTCSRDDFPDACLKPLRGGEEGETHPGDVKVKERITDSERAALHKELHAIARELEEFFPVRWVRKESFSTARPRK